MRGFIFFLFTAAAVHACDLCGATLIQRPSDPRTGFSLGASEQFTRMRSLYHDGAEIANNADQKLDSSITQVFLGYHFIPTLGVQVNVPLIHRTFRRATEHGIESGRERGLGDASVTLNWLAINETKGDFSFQFSPNIGVKFPTGDSDRLKEEGAHHDHEAAEGDEHAGEEGGEEEAGEHADDADHNEIPEGVHGHDLALGTGSVDLVLGASFHARWKRIFFTGELQYAVRGDGEHNYDFGNDLLWSGGPGVTLLDRPTHTLAVQLICSGESKSEDEYRGVRSDDTAMTQVFLGPKVSTTWRDRFSADVELALPVHQDNSGVQIQPDYRLRAVLSWAF